MVIVLLYEILIMFLKVNFDILVGMGDYWLRKIIVFEIGQFNLLEDTSFGWGSSNCKQSHRISLCIVIGSIIVFPLFLLHLH